MSEDKFKAMVAASQAEIENFNDFAGDRAQVWAAQEITSLRARISAYEEANALRTANGTIVEADLRARLEKAEKDAKRLHAIRELCGYVEDGSAQTVRIFQDDATKDWFICFGQHGREFARSFEAAIDAVIAKGKQC